MGLLHKDCPGDSSSSPREHGTYNLERRFVVIESGWPPLSFWETSSSMKSFGGISIAGEQLKNPCGFTHCQRQDLLCQN
jgi:hypothetical protein